MIVELLEDPLKPKITLVKFNYLRSEGFDRTGYEQFVLTETGVSAGKVIDQERLDTRAKIESKANGLKEIREKAELFDQIVRTVTNPDVGSLVFTLPNGWKMKFDRSGPSKLILQIVRQGQP
jgi:hypothetical protein